MCMLCRLDVGHGKDLDLKECQRSKLRQQCIKYLGPVCACIIHIQDIVVDVTASVE